MLQTHIETVKQQIAFFDHKLGKHPKDSRVQAIYWPLKYRFEQLLQFLQNNNSSPKIETDFAKSITLPRNRASHEKTEQLEALIIEIASEHPNGLHIDKIYEQLISNYPDLNYSKVANRISNLYAKKGILMRIGKGIYKVKI